MSTNYDSVTPGGRIPTWTLADRLRKAREDSGLSQGALAREIDISQKTVSNYENGNVEPRRIAVKQWAMRTDVDLHWLETGEVPSPDDDGTNGEPPVGLEPTAFALQGASVLEFPCLSVA